MGRALPAQCDLARRAGGREADSRSRPLRFQLALRHRDRLFLCCNRLRLTAWSGAFPADEDFSENASANAARHDCNLFHVGAGLCDALLGPGRGVGSGIHAYWMVVSILRDILGLAGGCAHRQRHFRQCAFWQSAENYLSTTRHRPDSDVCG